MRWRDDGKDKNHVEEIFTNDAYKAEVPPNLIDGLKNYMLYGRGVGHFLTAMIKGDLYEACARADLESQRYLFKIAAFIYNEFPSGAFGTPEKHDSWRARGGYAGVTGDARFKDDSLHTR